MKKSVINLLSMLMLFCGYAQEGGNNEILRDSIESILKEKHIPGAFVSVVSNDSILFENGFGYADIQSKTKVNTDHLFKIGSVSKTFTALAIMNLVEKGKLSLNDKLADLAPEIPFTNKWEDTNPVQIKHLLEHKAGFDDMPLSVVVNDRPVGMTALEEVMMNKDALRSRWQPGLGHSYSNPGYTILGYLIEKISQRKYQEYIRNEVLAPLQMRKSVFRSEVQSELKTDIFATGYRYSNDGIAKTKDAKIIGEAAGALLSNADDMSRFLQFLLNQTMQDNLGIVSASGIQEMETLHGILELENDIDKGYSLGLYTRTYGSSKIPFIGHSGGIHGFSSDFIYSRELNLAVAISNNGEGGNRDVLDLLVDTFVKEAPIKSGKSEVDLSQFSDWNGQYRMLTTRNQVFDFIQFPLETVEIEVSKDSLYLTRFLQEKEAFVHQKRVAFIEKGDSNPSLFLVQKDGEKYLNYNKDLLVSTNNLSFLLLRILLAFSLLTAIAIILMLLVSGIISIFRKKWRPIASRNLVFALPFIFLFVSLFLFLSNTSLAKLTALGQLNWVTVTIFLLTILLPIAALWSAYWLFRKKGTPSKRFGRIGYNLVVLGSILLSVYCIYHGWFFKMLWPA